MAERRMFAKSIVLSDAFLDMPMSARCLYFTLGMLADDEGFVGNAKSIMRQCGASPDDMNVLLAKRYVLGFESGVIVIKHWKLNNYLRNDRFSPTTYIEEKDTLTTDQKGAYTEQKNDAVCEWCASGIPSIGKDSIGKDNNIIIESSPNFSDEFEEIWAIYPKKQGKSQALTKYKSARKKGVEYETILIGLNNYLSYIKSNNIENKYIKNGDTWFNYHWEDEYEITKPQGTSYDVDEVRAKAQKPIEYKRK